MRFFRIYVLFTFCLLGIREIGSSLYAFPDRDARGNFSENFTHLQLKVHIAMPSVSYVEGEDIPLEFKIQNSGKEVVRIFPATNPDETFQLQIRDENNRLVLKKEKANLHPWNPKYQWDRRQNKRNAMENTAGDSSKEIALAPGESFSFQTYLQENYELEPGKYYSVHGYFYPNATESRKNFLLGGTDSEGRLSFMRSGNSLRFYYDKRRKEMEISGIRKENFTVGSGISPEETLFLFLGAELKKNWSNYFKWLYLPDFVLAYDRFSGVYLSAGEREKELVLDEFKNYLVTLPSGKLKNFKVVSVEQQSEREAKVKVFAERWEERIPTRYEYEYVLKKSSRERSSLWKIHGVVARVRK